MTKRKKLSLLFILLFSALSITTTVFAFTGSHFYGRSVCNYAPMYSNCNSYLSPSAVWADACGGGEDYLVVFRDYSSSPSNMKVFSTGSWWSAEKIQINLLGGLDGFYDRNGTSDYDYYVCSTDLGNPWNIKLHYFD